MMTARSLKQTFQTPVKGKLANLGASINSNPGNKVNVPFSIHQQILSMKCLIEHYDLINFTPQLKKVKAKSLIKH